ncbi:MAG: Fic family protein [Candidatus Aquilonibacter sp.]|jgi:Fic family protein
MHQRAYEGSHPWLTFRLDTAMRETPALWMLLGECQAKCEHLAGVLIDPAYAAKLQVIYCARGASASTQIEGNPLTEEQALAAIEHRLHLPAAQAYQETEVMNIVNACNEFLAELERGDRPAITYQRISDLNRKVLNQIPNTDDNVVPGEISRRGVVVGDGIYRGAPREDCKFLLDQMCAFLNGYQFDMPDSATIARAILQAIVAHLYLAWIHPFGDGNGRTARLLEVQILLASGAPAPAAHLLNTHYNQTRDAYYRTLRDSSAHGGDIRSFILYALRGLVEGLANQLAEVGEYQRDVIWRDYVNNRFVEIEGKPAIRQQRLLLILSGFQGPILPSKLRSQSPHAKALYAQFDQKTLTRDINTLKQMGFLRQSPGGLIVDKDVLKAFAVRQYPVRPTNAAVA